MLAPAKHTDTVVVREAELGALPDGWAVTTLGDSCRVIQGQSPPGTTYNTEGVGLPFLQGKAEFGDTYPAAVKWCSAPSKIAEPDDVLISIRAPVGPTNLCAVQSCIGRGLAAIRTQGSVPSKYVLYAIRATEKELRAKSTGTTFEAIRGDNLRSHLFLLPPLPEQHRIVAEIEKQFTRLDASVAALKHAQANLKRYRVSVLKAACEGKLVPIEAELAKAEGRDYEHASVLLERILTQRRVRWESQPKRRGKYKEPVEPDTANLPDLPEGWVWTTVAQLIVEPLTNGRSVKTAGEGFPVLRLTALQEGAIDETEHKIGNWTAEQAAPFLIRKGDFFVSRGNGSIRLVGIGGLVIEAESAVAFPDTMIRFRLSGSVLKQYFSGLWNSPVVRTQVEATARTTAGIYKVNQQDLAAMPIPLPPLAEQHRIVAEVERLLSVIQETETAVESNLTRAERLRQSILKQAFSGKLVPQDPNDEPATVLLERIRAEREAAEAAARSDGTPRRGRSKKSNGRQGSRREAAP